MKKIVLLFVGAITGREEELENLYVINVPISVGTTSNEDCLNSFNSCVDYFVGLHAYNMGLLADDYNNHNISSQTFAQRQASAQVVYLGNLQGCADSFNNCNQ